MAAASTRCWPFDFRCRGGCYEVLAAFAAPSIAQRRRHHCRCTRRNAGSLPNEYLSDQTYPWIGLEAARFARSGEGSWQRIPMRPAKQVRVDVNGRASSVLVLSSIGPQRSIAPPGQRNFYGKKERKFSEDPACGYRFRTAFRLLQPLRARTSTRRGHRSTLCIDQRYVSPPLSVSRGRGPSGVPPPQPRQN
jgi:hypothetical protein